MDEGISFSTLALAKSYTDEHGGGGGGETSKPKVLQLTIGTAWTGDNPYQQSISVTGYSVTTKTKVDLDADSNTIDEMLSMEVSQIYIENNNGTLTAIAIGEKPTRSLPVQAIFSEVK